MKKLLSVVIVAATFSITGQAMAATQITGAGSSFIYPVLSKWAATYHKKIGVEINYQPIGSGGPLPSFETKHPPNPFYIWSLMGKEIEKILIFILSKLLPSP